jgi:hypothetical protein
LRTVPPAKLGLVLTTSGAPPRWLKLPHGYQFIDVREIAHAMNNRLAIDKNKLLRWIKGLRKGLDKPARLHAGRPSEGDLVNSIFRERRARNLPVINQRAEAEAIRADIASHYPDHHLPAIKTHRGTSAQLVPIGEGHRTAICSIAQSVERGGHCGRAIVLVIICHGSGAALLPGWAGLGLIERLGPAVLVDGEDHGLVRRIEIEADYVGDFRVEFASRLWRNEVLFNRMKDFRLLG